MSREHKKIYHKLLEEFVDDIESMTDEEILAEAEEAGFDIAVMNAEFETIFESAKREARRIRSQNE